MRRLCLAAQCPILPSPHEGLGFIGLLREGGAWGGQVPRALGKLRKEHSKEF